MLSFLRKPAAMDNTTTTAADADPAAPLLSTFQVRAQAGEPVAVVRVRNLAATIPCGRDAWGRSGKVQPVLLSSELSFRSGFQTSSADDRLVDSETVHYGNLSKTLLAGVEGLSSAGAAASNTTTSSTPSSSAIFELLWVRLTGRVLDGSRVALPLDQVPFLDAAALRSLSLTINLPKASLLGAGVSLTSTASFKDRDTLLGGGDDDNNDKNTNAKSKDDGDEPEKKKNPLTAYARSLRISGLHVPTLIGVNDNERKARQMLVAEVEIDRFDITGDDVHDQIERVVVEVMEASSFETLEALGTHIATKILDDFQPSMFPEGSSPAQDEAPPAQTMRERGWLVRVSLEKPIAVPFAECPAVEVRMGQGLP
ncbi:Dihydroneopterin aldolase-domain-containing protein [Microdochium bolleyi]|uniref:dihydroneopterin aldolase n=1 Tax=Microdochium bolleyi TaxID=196109 RepID=A0A136JF14_9PEZI|nr:Dihydroneopterin aldolase-domain-containing protein [Microdochium bolleyi]